MALSVTANEFPAYWTGCVNGGRIDEVIALYAEGAVLMPTFSPHAARTREAITAYFTQLAARDSLAVALHDATVYALPTGAGGTGGYVVNGIYDFRFAVDGTLLTFPSRFTFVLDLERDSPILHHHSSQIPRTLS